MSARVGHGLVIRRPLRRNGAAMLCMACALAALPLRAQADAATAPYVHSAALAATNPDLAKGTGFAVDHYTIDNGGGTSSGGAFSISGTIGQPDADPLQPSTGGVFAITGGFWPGAGGGSGPDGIFANGFEPP